MDNSGEVYTSFRNAADQPNTQPNRAPIVYEELPTPKVGETFHKDTHAKHKTTGCRTPTKPIYFFQQLSTPVYTDNDVTTRQRRRLTRGKGRRSGRVGKGRRMGRRPEGQNKQPRGKCTFSDVHSVLRLLSRQKTRTLGNLSAMLRCCRSAC